MFGIKEYPASTRPGLLNGLLSLPFELVLTQSFAFLSKADAKTVLTRKQNQLRLGARSGRLADRGAERRARRSRIEPLRARRSPPLGTRLRRDAEAACGPHEPRAPRARRRRRGRRARGFGIRGGLLGAAPGPLQIPRPRRRRSPHAISRRSPPSTPIRPASADGNHWGPAVAMLETASGSPFYFSFHHGDLGNTFICGPSGSGKTVVQNFLLSQAERLGASYVFFDKDRGAEIFVRAAGGTYLTLRNGAPTGCAPLKALELTPGQSLVPWRSDPQAGHAREPAAHGRRGGADRFGAARPGPASAAGALARGPAGLSRPAGAGRHRRAARARGSRAGPRLGARRRRRRDRPRTPSSSAST